MATNTKKKLSRTDLNAIMKTLPTPIQEHGKRCKLLASFLVEQVKTEDWFLDSKLNPTYIIDAITYHDIGKSALRPDTYYWSHSNTAQKKRIYRTHVEKGIETVVSAMDVSFEDSSPRSFERYLYLAITEHHESVSGDGFPKGLLKGEISIVGKIAAIVDSFDHLLFVGKTDEIDLDNAVAELRNQAGKTLDPYLVNVFLENIDTLKKSVEYILLRDKNKRRTDAYGIKLFYHSVYDIRDNTVDSYRVELRLNDPYYGIVKPTAFIAVAEQSGQIFRLEKLAFERLCQEMDALYDPEKPLIECIVPLSARQFEKKGFLKFIKTVTSKYEIEPRQLLFSVRNVDMTDTEVAVDWQNIIDTCRKEGFRFILEDFGDGSSLLSHLDTLSVDRICMKPEYAERILENPKTYSVVSGLVKIASTLQIMTMFTNVEKRAQEANLLAMGVKYACGELYGEALTWKELRDGDAPTPEGDDGGDAV